MPQNQPTSVDVARLAGVAQSTVSRAFDPNSRISTSTRARVMAAAEELGYQQNVIARSLISQRTDIVGIVMANITASHFYPGVLEQFTHRLQEIGKQVLLLSAPPESSAEEMLPRVLGYQVAVEQQQYYQGENNNPAFYFCPAVADPSGDPVVFKVQLAGFKFFIHFPGKIIHPVRYFAVNQIILEQ